MKHPTRIHPVQGQREQNHKISIQISGMDPVHNKISDTSGESIAETLIAVLIAAFALLMLAGTVNTSTNLVTKSREVLNEYYDANKGLENKSTSNENVESESGIVTLSGYPSLDITMYKNARLQSKTVIAYYYKGNGAASTSPTDLPSSTDGD